MKTLYLLRHAKSDSSGWGGQDFERPLNERGKEACATVAGHLRQQGILPDIILCSTAVRARETLTGIAGPLGWTGADNQPQLVLRDELYLASQNEILAEVRSLDNNAASAMVIGHNPGLEVLAADLTGGGDRDAIKALGRTYPTGGLATLAFESDQWGDLGPGRCQLTDFVKPSRLSAAY